MDSVNVEMDLRNFIRAARREVASDAAVAAQAAAAAENETAAATATAAVPVSTGAAAPSSAAGPAEAVALANEVGNGVVGAEGAGVLSSRADQRATALAFQRLFGVGPVCVWCDS